MSHFDISPTPPPAAAYQPPTRPVGDEHHSVSQSPHGFTNGVSVEDRNLGTIAHVAPLVLMVASGGVAGFLGSLGVYLYAKDRGPAAREYATGALNAQIAISIAAVVSWVLTVVLVGFLLLPVVFVFGLVVHTVGAIKANKGEAYTPPFTPRFIN